MEKFVINNFLKHLILDCGLKKEFIEEMIAYAKQQQVSFITYLIQTKKIDSSCLAQLLAKEFFLEYIDLDTIDVLQIPSCLIDKNLQQKYQILPLWQDKKKLGLVLVDPTQQLVFDTIRFTTGLMLEYKIADEKKLVALLKKVISLKKQTISRVIGVNRDKEAQLKEINNLDSSFNNSSSDDLTIINYVYKFLIDAITRNASDIHIEPYQEQLEIRFRIDGLLYSIVVLPKHLIPRVITRLKIMSQLDIAERRIPQDGRFQVKDRYGRNVDCRLSTCPTIHGEKLVIRILDSNKMLLEIDKLGMNRKQIGEFITALKSPHGMILVTGPTGSGKTITLYTALSFLKKPTVNISTVENPIEIILPGINQVNINPAIGLNFACVLRAFLRQDPDIIMVGEMRDQETAEIGIKAAQTGHLVLSTLHTNSAIESLIRLENMNIPTYNIVASVNLIIAQRLVRRLCTQCKIEEQLPEKFLFKLNLIPDPNIKIFTARGCSQCTDGYKGRTGIFEILTLTEEMKKIILEKNNVLEIKEFAQKQGMQTLYLSALEKLKQGEISLLEMKRIIKD
ncbi:MAG: ATPase, T2SS/T4P/T4SS family [Candidatus Rickettsiella isopodorum]|nr:Flp pilus assembly complex ATPase component TadA [Gammaproteobacteria bacterium]MCH9754341.1 Flp pilus assembly complex ATPase component TadA [Gammaproteobacteria bacterium]MDD5161639.1 ATPase, T2SS/T4P/T4SS family [Candidatus Rickettsiella isopodorum]